MPEIKAIETEYNGYKFRSRLEARWAVFFDEAKIPYVYEPEGFEASDGTRYLPDFYLPDDDIYVEVKPNRPESSKELGKAVKVMVTEHHKILLMLREVPYKEECGVWWFPVFYFNPLSRDMFGCRLTFLPEFDDCSTEPTRLRIERTFYAGLKAVIVPIKHNTGALCNAINDMDLAPGFYDCSARVRLNHPFINHCLKTARQARFEHGSKPGAGR